GCRSRRRPGRVRTAASGCAHPLAPPPNRRPAPKPALQPFGPLSLIAIEVAATAPFASVAPVAVAHLPTVAAALVAVTTLVTALDPIRVSVTGPGLGVAGAAADGLAIGRNPTRSVPLSMI